MEKPACDNFWFVIRCLVILLLQQGAPPFPDLARPLHPSGAVGTGPECDLLLVLPSARPRHLRLLTLHTLHILR
jgi:hypothetical protein